jgi:hypothetical protein
MERGAEQLAMNEKAEEQSVFQDAVDSARVAVTRRGPASSCPCWLPRATQRNGTGKLAGALSNR